LWIDGETYAEGIAGWKISLLELLYVAQKIDATLVEPCMSSGRLRSCRYEPRGIPVGDIFDLDEYMKPSSGGSNKFPVLVPYDDYQKALGNTTVGPMVAKVCMTNNPRKFNLPRCTKGTTRIIKMKQNSIQRMMDKSEQEHFVLHMEDYWRQTSIYKLGWQLGMYIPDDEDERFERGMNIPAEQVFEDQTLPFHPRHVQFVDDLLHISNITNNNFSAIHWRAEKEGMDFVRCARAVNEAKRIMLHKMMSSTNATQKKEESRQHKFVLLSSLNENEDMMWLESRKTVINENRTKSSQQALGYLRDNGFIKIDGLLEAQAETKKVDDQGMLAIYDLIIATKASNFATCARGGKAGCNAVTNELCDACNHVGKFGHFAISLRKQKADRRESSSWECWPSEVK